MIKSFDLKLKETFKNRFNDNYIPSIKIFMNLLKKNLIFHV